jgi:membrane-bound serine protease (ClpP class)
MRRGPTLRILRAFLAVCLFGAAAPVVMRAADVVLLRYSGPIGPVASSYVSRGIAEAEQAGAAAVVLELDTPGGLDSSMRVIIQREMNARIPVIVYVAPRGARAASAGCLIALAADVAAMAPGTNIGAAGPVGPEGSLTSQKILNDAAAYARSLAAAHHRNQAWAEQAVRQSVSVSADEALQLGVIDVVAPDLNALLRQLDGRRINGPKGEQLLSLASPTVIPVEMTWREHLLNGLANPDLAYVLVVLGLLAVIIEVFAPHGLVTGTIGALSLIVGLVGMALIPIGAIGMSLLVLGMVMLVLELKILSHGLLTFFGVICFALGSMLLVPHVPGYRLSTWLVALVALIWVAVTGIILRQVMLARRKPVLTGLARLVGAQGVAKTDLAPHGVVLINGEDWDAEAEIGPVDRGDRVQVFEVRGLTLRVRKIT